MPYGQLAAIGATALPLTATSTPIRTAVKVKALGANGANLVYVGLTAGVTTATGYQLAAGADVEIPWNLLPTGNITDIYVIGSTTGLAVSWMAG